MVVQGSLFKLKWSKSPKKTKMVTCHIDLYKCHQDLVTSGPHLREYVQKLIDIFGYNCYGALHQAHYGDQVATKGFSIMQLLDKGCITAHFIDQDLSAHIDITSHQPIDSSTVLKLTKKFFEAETGFVKQHLR